MSELWEPKADYRRLEAENFPLNEFHFDAFNNQFLPYERLYEHLDEQELRELLADAKKFHWQVLDLRSCGLASLPEDDWDLPDLMALYLGNSTLDGEFFLIRFPRS